jgi:hypothetical protein
MGPGQLTVGGRATTVSAELRDLYPALEEAKADTLGLWCLLRLMDDGTLPPNTGRLYPTYLAGLFRAFRFGIGEPTAGTTIQYNTHEGGDHSATRPGGSTLIRPMRREALARAAAAGGRGRLHARLRVRAVARETPEVRAALTAWRACLSPHPPPSSTSSGPPQSNRGHREIIWNI